MNLNISTWKPFLVGKIFDVKYGVNLELDSLTETTEKGCINFVSRCISNNGVSAKVEPIEGLEPQEAGIISVAGGGSSVLSTYVQEDPFYSGRDLYLLIPKLELSKETKFFITTIIEKNKYRYSFGRQANKTLPNLEVLLPIKYFREQPVIDDDKKYSDEGYIPDWEYMENYIKSLHYKPLTTANYNNGDHKLDVSDWEDFAITQLFDIERGSITSLNEIEEGDVPIVSASGENEGISFYANINAPYENNITISMNGVNTGFTSYHGYPFNINIDCCVLKQKFALNKYIALFIVTIINQLRNKYSYGRKMSAERIEKEHLKLPIKRDNQGKPIIDENRSFSDKGYIPDWEYMEHYIKTLPYGDKI